MLLLIDNYDSFTFNLVHYFGELGLYVKVYRNDCLSVEEILALQPRGIVLSPGPCTPNEAGVCLAVVKAAAETDIPLLGVCLGHQVVGQAFGGIIQPGKRPMHGKVTLIYHDDHPLFGNIPNPFLAARYHSLVVDPTDLPSCLTITAQDKEKTIMALSHQDKPIYGVQFHPESIASEYGHVFLKNFIQICHLI